MNILAASGLESVLKLITLLIIFAIVLLVTYYVTVWIGNYQRKSYANGNIQIIEAKQVGNNKYIYVARIGNEYFALSSGKDNLSVISKLDEEGLVLPDENETKKLPTFSDVIEKVKKIKKEKPKE